jgi:hypothetical protein
MNPDDPDIDVARRLVRRLDGTWVRLPGKLWHAFFVLYQRRGHLVQLDIALWPGWLPADPKKAVREIIYRLRKLLVGTHWEIKRWPDEGAELVPAGNTELLAELITRLMVGAL